MGDVVRLRCITTLPLPVTRIIDDTPRDLSEIIVIGIDKEGDFYIATSEADGGNVLWWIEMAKRKLIDTALAMEK